MPQRLCKNCGEPVDVADRRDFGFVTTESYCEDCWRAWLKGLFGGIGAAMAGGVAAAVAGLWK